MRTTTTTTAIVAVAVLAFATFAHAGSIVDYGKICLEDSYSRVYGFHTWLQNESFVAWGTSHDFRFYKDDLCFLQPIVVSGWIRLGNDCTEPGQCKANFAINVLGASPDCPNRTVHVAADYSIPQIEGWQQKENKSFSKISLTQIECPDDK